MSCSADLTGGHHSPPIRATIHKSTTPEPMNITLTGYQETAIMQAIMDSLMLWDDRIEEALAGKRPAMSVEGARLMIEDLREVQLQIKAKR